MYSIHSSTPPIGTSLLEGHVSDQHEEPTSAMGSDDYISRRANLKNNSGNSRNSVIRPSLLSTALSMDIESIVNDCDHGFVNKNIHSDSILLQGPDQSGRSSLAMDLAIELSANAPCRCNILNSCQCLPVAFLRSDSKSDESFPIRCQQHVIPETTLDNTEIHDRIQQLTKKRSEGSSWNARALRKIEVHHLVSFRDCLQYFLSLQGKAEYEQPYKAVIIDDIDCLVDDCLGGNERSMQVAQFLAVVFDTMNFLNHRPLLCVCINTNINFPLDCFVASFFTCIVSIHDNSYKDNDNNDNNNSNNNRNNTNHKTAWLPNICKEHNDVILNSWTTTTKSRGEKNKKNKELEYVICQTENGDHRILWKTMD